MDYTDYLKSLHIFDDKVETKDLQYRKYVVAFIIMNGRPNVSTFRSYLQNLLEYFIAWYRRAMPLTDVDSLLKQAEELVEKCWGDGKWSWEKAEKAEKEEAERAINAVKTEDTIVRYALLLHFFY